MLADNIADMNPDANISNPETPYTSLVSPQLIQGINTDNSPVLLQSPPPEPPQTPLLDADTTTLFSTLLGDTTTSSLQQFDDYTLTDLSGDPSISRTRDSAVTGEEVGVSLSSTQSTYQSWECLENSTNYVGEDDFSYDNDFNLQNNSINGNTTNAAASMQGYAHNVMFSPNSALYPQSQTPVTSPSYTMITPQTPLVLGPDGSPVAFPTFSDCTPPIPEKPVKPTRKSKQTKTPVKPTKPDSPPPAKGDVKVLNKAARGDGRPSAKASGGGASGARKSSTSASTQAPRKVKLSDNESFIPTPPTIQPAMSSTSSAAFSSSSSSSSTSSKSVNASVKISNDIAIERTVACTDILLVDDSTKDKFVVCLYCDLKLFYCDMLRAHSLLIGLTDFSLLIE